MNNEKNQLNVREIKELEAILRRVRQKDGLFSIYDVIRECGQKNSRDAWKRLTISYPEIVAKCDTRQLINKAGQRGKATPVADRTVMLEIIGLLPGAIGKKYRKVTAQLLIMYLENPDILAKQCIDRCEDKNQLEAVKSIKQHAHGATERLNKKLEQAEREWKANDPDGKYPDAFAYYEAQDKAEIPAEIFMESIHAAIEQGDSKAHKAAHKALSELFLYDIYR